jgi:glycosyltransferase involved in cell wall biosynthesis
VWDNKSTDSTADIVKKFEQLDFRFRLYSGAEPLTLGAARNMAVKKAIGTYIAFLDSDDLWDSNFLHQHYDLLRNISEPTFGVGNVVEIKGDFDLSKFIQTPAPETQFPASLFTKLLKGNFIYFSSIVIPKSFFQFEPGFRNDFVQAEDYELILRIASKMRCYKTGLVYYRIHSGNATNLQEESLYREAIDILNSYKKFIPAKIHRWRIIGNYYNYLILGGIEDRKNRILKIGVSPYEIYVALGFRWILKTLRIFKSWRHQ